jgi:DNA-binding NarL/FixJ family response regulator
VTAGSGDELLRVLIADDHAPTRDDIRRALDGDERFEVCAEVADAAAAVEAGVRERPDVCLLDVRMPGSGLAAAWELSARLPQAKIVMLTVSEEDRDLFAAIQAGAAGYLSKTMDLERLPDALAGVCAGEAAMQRRLVARVLERLHEPEPRRRRIRAEADAPERRLTTREWEVLKLLADGRSTREIAARLTLSESTVRVHVRSIVHKLEVADRDAAVELFRRRLES